LYKIIFSTKITKLKKATLYRYSVQSLFLSYSERGKVDYKLVASCFFFYFNGK